MLFWKAVPYINFHGQYKFASASLDALILQSLVDLFYFVTALISLYLFTRVNFEMMADFDFTYMINTFDGVIYFIKRIWYSGRGIIQRDSSYHNSFLFCTTQKTEKLVAFWQYNDKYGTNALHKS